MILVDTSGLLAALDASEQHHAAAAAALRAAGAPRLLSPFVLAELDYLLSTRVSTTIARAFLDEGSRWGLPARAVRLRRHRGGGRGP